MSHIINKRRSAREPFINSCKILGQYSLDFGLEHITQPLKSGSQLYDNPRVVNVRISASPHFTHSLRSPSLHRSFNGPLYRFPSFTFSSSSSLFIAALSFFHLFFFVRATWSSFSIWTMKPSSPQISIGNGCTCKGGVRAFYGA